MQKNDLKLEKGNFLVSQPFMIDGNFRRTVIYLAEYNDLGALGFIINRPMDYKADELIADFPKFDDSAYFGGPVATNTIQYVHRKGDILDDSIEIKDGVYWGGDFNKLKFFIEEKLITPKDLKFYVGYTGWSAGQLEDELTHGSWIIAPSDENFIFNNSGDNTWIKVLEDLGENFEVIAQMPESFYLN